MTTNSDQPINTDHLKTILRMQILAELKIKNIDPTKYLGTVDSILQTRLMCEYARQRAEQAKAEANEIAECTQQRVKPRL